jgi:hypothetical protein
MALVRLPGLKMVANRKKVESGLLCRYTELDQFRDPKLFMRQLEPYLPMEPTSRYSTLPGHGALNLRG